MLIYVIYEYIDVHTNIRLFEKMDAYVDDMLWQWPDAYYDAFIILWNATVSLSSVTRRNTSVHRFQIVLDYIDSRLS